MIEPGSIRVRARSYTLETNMKSYYMRVQGSQKASFPHSFENDALEPVFAESP